MAYKEQKRRLVVFLTVMIGLFLFSLNIVSSAGIAINVTDETTFDHLTLNSDSVKYYNTFDRNSSLNIYDYSNFNNDGVLNNTLWSNLGYIGGSYNFNGANSSIIIPYSQSLNLTRPFSISMWFNGTTLATGKTLIGEYNGVADGWRIFMNTNTKMRFEIVDGAGANKAVTSTTSFIAGTWYHIVAVAEPTRTVLYINGVQEDTLNSNGIRTSNMPLTIGSDSSTSTTDNWAGLIDQVMITNTTLNSSDVNKLFNFQYARFFQTGTDTYNNIFVSNSSIVNRLNITLDCQSYNGTTLAFQAGWVNGTQYSYGDIANLTNCVLTNYSFPLGLASNISTRYYYYSNFYQSYSPIILNKTIIAYSVGDFVNPNATLLQPIDNLYTNITGVNFTINATDNIGLSNITLYIYNGTAIVTQQTESVSGSSGIFGIFFNFLFNDVFTWFYKVVDTAGNIFTTGNRTIIVDTIYPQLAISYPSNSVNYNYVVSNITHHVNETNLAYCTFSNGTFTTNITCNAPYYFNASQNTNVWVITATDLAGQSYAKPVNFLVDTIYPTISFGSGTPPNNTISKSGTGYVNVTINETNFYSINYLIANSTQIIHDITFYTPITSVLFVNQSENTYYYNVTIEDIVGHRTTTETRIYIVDKTPPSLIVNSPITTNYTNNSILVNLTTDGIQAFYTNGLEMEQYLSPIFATYPQGYFNFTAIAEDVAGNQNITNFQFFVDSLPPNITYVSPTELNNSVKATNSIRINVNAIEASFANITIKLYNSTQSEIASSISNSTLHFVEFVNLTNGIYYFNATACDVFSICSSAETRKVTINQGLLGSLKLSLIVSQYPYVDVNVTYPINVELNVGDIVVSDAIVNFTLTLLNGTQISSIMPYNSTTGYYKLSLIFDEVGNFPFMITANSSAFGSVSESGTFIARVPFYLTVKLFEQGNLNPIENDFAYITAEYVGTRKIDDFVEPFIYPIADNRFVAKSFHAPYINGEAQLKLYEPQTDYVFRYFDGVVNFDGEYSAPNVTKSYGTEVYLGTQYVNGTDSLYQFVLSQKDLKPYFWLFNWILIILLVLVGVGSLAMFFFFPDKPQIALIFGVLFTFVLIGIRVAVYLWMGQ